MFWQASGLMLCIVFLFHASQVASGLERGGFTFQGEIHGKDFGRFKLERQGNVRFGCFQSKGRSGFT